MTALKNRHLLLTIVCLAGMATLSCAVLFSLALSRAGDVDALSRRVRTLESSVDALGEQPAPRFSEIAAELETIGRNLGESARASVELVDRVRAALALLPDTAAPVGVQQELDCLCGRATSLLELEARLHARAAELSAEAMRFSQR